MAQLRKPAEIAKELSISTETLRQYAEEGRIPSAATTPGGHRRYVLEDVRHALAMEKAVKIAPLEEGEQEPRLNSETNLTPIRRAPRWQATSPDMIVAETNSNASEHAMLIPFVGKPGTSRFIVGKGALA